MVRMDQSRGGRAAGVAVFSAVVKEYAKPPEGMAAV